MLDVVVVVEVVVLDVVVVVLVVVVLFLVATAGNVVDAARLVIAEGVRLDVTVTVALLVA